jgi:hypothetical protein
LCGPPGGKIPRGGKMNILIKNIICSQPVYIIEKDKIYFSE